MTVIWGIHNDQPSLDLVSGGFVSVGWGELGDLRNYADREALKPALLSAYPDAKAGAIPVWAGVLHRFSSEIAVGDLIVAPNKTDSTINIGRVAGEYYWDPAASAHPNRRPVEWLQIGIPRVAFSKAARDEIGSAVTLFRVKRHAAEFLARLDSEPHAEPEPPELTDDAVIQVAEEEPNAERIQAYTRDFIIETLYTDLDPYRFEQFTAALLRAMGYEARVTKASGDGGVDVIAHRDTLGLEPPIIKVQCKRTLGTTGGPDVQKLAGTLAPGGVEVGLFVNLGTYSSDAQHLERTRQDLRLIDGSEFVRLVLSHYDSLDPEWKRAIPLRQVFVVDPDDGIT